MSATNKFILQVSKTFLKGIDRTSSPAPIGKLRNAIDFIVPRSTACMMRLLSVFCARGINLTSFYKNTRIRKSRGIIIAAVLPSVATRC